MKQVPYWGPTNIRHHCIHCSRPVDLATGLCAPLLYWMFVSCSWQGYGPSVSPAVPSEKISIFSLSVLRRQNHSLSPLSYFYIHISNDAIVLATWTVRVEGTLAPLSEWSRRGLWQWRWLQATWTAILISDFSIWQWWSLVISFGNVNITAKGC
jgi:hypothetical protein